MQAQRDKIWTTLGWSLAGNVAGVGVATYLHNNSDKYRSLKQFKRREFMQVGGFLFTVAIFTLYGYGSADVKLKKTKYKLVEEHSIGFSEK